MKVNTDGVLLGAAMTLNGTERNLLDVGTGTGVIALMAAQRLESTGAHEFTVCAIDIDSPSAEEASLNFRNSPWADHLEISNTSLQAYEPDKDFDLIFSNPPYFDNSLENPDRRKTEARHTESLSYREICSFSSNHLSEDGRLAIILPSEEKDKLFREGRSYGLFPCRLVLIRTTEKKKPRRIIAEFSRKRTGGIETTTLTIQKDGKYTDEYQELTGSFYIFL